MIVSEGVHRCQMAPPSSKSVDTASRVVVESSDFGNLVGIQKRFFRGRPVR